MGAKHTIVGSARGVRVAGSIWALLVVSAGLFLKFAFSYWQPLVPAALIASFLAVRPWFMGIVFTPEAITVKGWYSSFRLSRAEVLHIDFRECISLLVGFGTGFLPLVGKIRMITVETQQGGKWRMRYLPGTLGRYNTVLNVVRETRVHLGLPR